MLITFTELLPKMRERKLSLFPHCGSDCGDYGILQSTIYHKNFVKRVKRDINFLAFPHCDLTICTTYLVEPFYSLSNPGNPKREFFGNNQTQSLNQQYVRQIFEKSRKHSFNTIVVGIGIIDHS